MRLRRGWTVLLVILAPLAVIVTVVVTVVLLLPGSSASACTRAVEVSAGGGATTPVEGFDEEQLGNAAAIMSEALTAGLDRRAQVIGVMTAIGESGLRVLDYGDAVGPDSRGLFQQRANGAWGSEADRMDPSRSAAAFFRALAAEPGWQDLPPTIAAHRVQGNADPFHYERFAADAERIVSALGGGGAACVSGPIALPLEPGYRLTSGFGPRGAVAGLPAKWHPALDLQNPERACRDQIYAIADGTVTVRGGYQVSITSPAGYTVSYLHMKMSDVAVELGETVQAGQPIALTGSEGPSTGCHLDLRINVSGTTDPRIAELEQSQDRGAPISGWVDPRDFFALYGVELCAPGSCS